MGNRLLAYRQKAQFLGHELWIAQRTDGNWQLWIEGKRPLQHDAFFLDQEEVKRVVHALGHWHLEEKHFCDCTTELRWEPVPPAESVPPEERRKAKRFTYCCDIQYADQGILSIGRVWNLSTEGAFIHTQNPPSEGSVITLSFQMGPMQIEAQGRVIRREPHNGMGVQFLDLSPSCHAAIAEGLARQERLGVDLLADDAEVLLPHQRLE